MKFVPLKNKYQQVKLFSCKAELSMDFFLLINIKMPTTVGILILISRKKFMLNSAEHERSFIALGPVRFFFLLKPNLIRH